jgi:hypothetical protein
VNGRQIAQKIHKSITLAQVLFNASFFLKVFEKKVFAGFYKLLRSQYPHDTTGCDTEFGFEICREIQRFWHKKFPATLPGMGFWKW